MNQLRGKVDGKLDIDTKKSVLNSLIKKLKVDQNGLLEIDFGVALGNTSYGVIRRVLVLVGTLFFFCSFSLLLTVFHVLHFTLYPF